MASPVIFERLWQRHQSFACEFSKLGYAVLYLQPLQSGGFSVSNFFKKDKISIINCKVPFKASSYPALNKIVAKISLCLLRRKLGIVLKDAILWLSEPSLACFTNYDWNKIIYDRCDLHGAFPGQKKQVWQKYEDLILKNCDLCIVSHKYLGKDIPEGIKTIIVKNAVSEDFLACNNIRQKNNSVLSLVSSGAHYEWVDFKWLKGLLKRKDVMLHIVGTGRGEEFNQLIKEDKVIYHGQVSHDKLKDLLKTFDVGLVPFKDIELVKGVDPVKVYEYAALGLEIWAPDLDCLHENNYIDCFVSLNNPNRLIKNKNKLDSSIPTWKDRLLPVLENL